MRRAITTVYLVVLDGDALQIEISGPSGWHDTLRELSARQGWTVALDQYGRRIASAECPVPCYPPVLTDRDGRPVVDDASARAAIELTERCTTARRAVEALHRGAISMVREWLAMRAERGHELPPWSGPCSN